MVYIRNAKLVLENGILWDGALLIEGGRIRAAGSAASLPAPSEAEVIDAHGLYVGPGFVDIHCHGGGGAMFDTDPETAIRHFLRHGETTVLATLYYDLSFEQMLASIAHVQDVMAHSPAGKAIGGLYMEGPYMNPQYGASPEKNKWRGRIDPAQAAQIVRQAGSSVRVWAVAPEREGIEEFAAMAKQANPSVRFAFGHTQATPAEIYRLKPYGLCIQTHSMDATGAPCSIGGTRACGPDEACLYDPDIYAEVICDSCGIHVHPDMLRLLRRLKGEERLILITDSFVSNERPPEALAHVTDLIYDANGGLCGSKLTMDVACRNMMTHTPAGICEVFRMGSLNPARAVGLGHEIGSIEPGKRADLVFVDDQFHVSRVMLGGAFWCDV